MSSSKKSASAPFITLVVVFFFWGFVAASNDILIPVFKSALNLSQLESQMISFAFYVAYTVGSLLYFFISGLLKRDILSRIGYRNGLALGLIISAAGTLLFIPASNSASFPLLIIGLFTVGLGFSLQQIAANPLAIQLGDPSKGNMRLSLAGGVNNVGTTIGPIIVSFAIFGGVSNSANGLNLEAVQIPYLVLGATFLLAAVFFKFSSVPDRIGEENQSNGGGIVEILRYPQVLLGMIAIFLYVGVEVSTASNLPEFMKQKLGTPESAVAPFVSLFWASLMIGRWTSASGAFDLKETTKLKLSLLLPFAAFGVFAFVIVISGHDIQSLYPYLLIVVILAVADAVSEGKPARQILIYSILGIIALIIGIFSNGMTSVFAFISVGLFCSTLWPCIFTLGIAGLGEKTNTASSLLIMMIMGGGVISLTQGALSSEKLLGIQHSYWVGVVCFAYLAFFAVYVGSILKKRGISFETTDGAGH
jgi:FHS family L-fucose permease-like MFS transporter